MAIDAIERLDPYAYLVATERRTTASPHA